MNEYAPLFEILDALGFVDWRYALSEQIDQVMNPQIHGDLARWQQILDALPVVPTSGFDFVNSVSIGDQADLTEQQRQLLLEGLQQLHPWRKGPFQLFGIDIDAEWRSDWKWQRLQPHMASLHNRLVLDVGCGNGYYCWRMLGAGARTVVGIDPTLLSVMQFRAIKRLYGRNAPVFVLPLGVESMPLDLKLFDSVFSMGVLYHRRSPIDHLMALKSFLRPGGQLILETIVVEGDEHTVLLPEQRYAQMRNVWFLPSCEALSLWLRRCGFKNVRVCDVSKTMPEEQRRTAWMRFNSLVDFLDPQNHELTCEGLPAPVRAVFIAEVD